MSKRVKTLIVSPLMPEQCKDKLRSLGFSIVFSRTLDSVQDGVKYHPDMQLVNCGKMWLCAPRVFEYYKPIFDGLGLCLACGDTVPKHDYPYDIAYNVAVMGSFAVHNFNYTDKKFIENSNYELINVSQGYAKCNLCIVTPDAAITSDEGIYRALLKKNIDVLKIDFGNIRLHGYDYGFIGGASGLIDDGLLAFCGKIELHPQGKIIKEFCAMHGVSVISLGNMPLVDIGTIIRPA